MRKHADYIYRNQDDSLRVQEALLLVSPLVAATAAQARVDAAVAKSGKWPAPLAAASAAPAAVPEPPALPVDAPTDAPDAPKIGS